VEVHRPLLPYVRPALLGALLVALAGSLMGLGFWQLGRADEKARLAAEFAASAALPALTEMPDASDEAAYHYRRLEVRGRYDSEQQILLDAMTYQGQAGYEVLTPFRPIDSRRWLLVNRGWIPAAPDRSQLPAVAVDTAVRTVVGRIADLPRPALRLGSAGAASAAPLQVLLFPTLAELGERLGRPLVGYQLWLDASEPDGFTRDWSIGGLPPTQHVAYAVQWFALAALVTVAGLVGAVRALRRARPHC
jgi:surfeit locus 1 family protein